MKSKISKLIVCLYFIPQAVCMAQLTNLTVGNSPNNEDGDNLRTIARKQNANNSWLASVSGGAAVQNMTAKTGHGGGQATNATPDFIGQIGTSDFGSGASYLWQAYGPSSGQWSQNWSFDFSVPGYFGNHENQAYMTPGNNGWQFWINGNRYNQTNQNESDVCAWFYNGNLWHYSQISCVGVVTNSVSGGVSVDLTHWASFGTGNPLSLEAFASNSFIVVIKQPFTISQTAGVGNDGIIGDPVNSGDEPHPDHQITTWDFVGHTIHFIHPTNSVYSFANPSNTDAGTLDYVNDTFRMRSNIIGQTIIGSNVVVRASSDAAPVFQVFKANGGKIGAMGIQPGTSSDAIWFGDVVPTASNYTFLEDDTSPLTRINDKNNTVIQTYLGNSQHIADFNAKGIDVFSGGVTLEANTMPTVSGSQVAIWNSNKVIFAVSTTKTNLISDLR